MKRKMIGAFALTIVVLVALSIPQGYAAQTAKGKHAAPVLSAGIQEAHYTRTNLQGVSNGAPASPTSGPASCGSLVFQGKFGAVMFNSVSLLVRLQHANSDTQYSVWLGYKTSPSSCDGSWNELGSLNTNHNGNGGFSQPLTLISGIHYQVVLRDQAGNTIYATAFFSP